MGPLVWLALSAAPAVKSIEVDSAGLSGTRKKRFVGDASTMAGRTIETAPVKDGASDSWSLETVPARTGMD